VLQFTHVFVLGTIIVAIAVAISTGSAYAHGCQAQGGCCSVGDACAEIGAVSPIYMMFATVGASAVAMLAFYGKQEGTSLGAIFNIFR
jgi:UDP-N-acetylmuramyl tripeptide synthase